MTFTPRLDILPPAQRALWRELSSTPDNFILYGGTALALHLGHRQSVDFDFFSFSSIDPIKLRDTIPYLAGAETMHIEDNTLTCSVDRNGRVKISFFGLPNICRVRPSILAPENGLKIASLLDIAGTKAQVVQARSSAKDYTDIDALITLADLPLSHHLAAAQIVYGPAFEPLHTLKALTYFEDVRGLSPVVMQRLIDAATHTDADALPVLFQKEPA